MNSAKKEVAARSQVFAALWTDAKYLELTERKYTIGREWRRAGEGGKLAERLGAAFDRACKRIRAYENAALAAAGLKA